MSPKKDPPYKVDSDTRDANSPPQFNFRRLLLADAVQLLRVPGANLAAQVELFMLSKIRAKSPLARLLQQDNPWSMGYRTTHPNLD